MSWDEFCKNHTIPRKYKEASISAMTIPDDANGDSYQRKAMSFLKNPRSLLLLGKAGRGKTYFMFAIMRALIELKKMHYGHVRFYRSIELDARLVSEFERWKSVDTFIKMLAEVEFLFIDDFGLERNTEKAERDFYDLIDRRTSEEKVTVYSSNLEEGDIKKIFGERIASRLKECAIVDFDGPDLRGGQRL